MIVSSVRKPGDDDGRLATYEASARRVSTTTYHIADGDGGNDLGEGRDEPLVQPKPAFSLERLRQDVTEAGVDLGVARGTRGLKSRSQEVDGWQGLGVSIQLRCYFSLQPASLLTIHAGGSDTP